MKGSFNHLELHVSKPNETNAFYKGLLGYFDWTVVAEWPGGLGLSDGNVSVWLFPTSDDLRSAGFNRDAIGLNHLGLKVDSQADVDAFVREYMQPKGIQAAFETPRARTDFGPTYYQVMFVDPEGLAIEVFTS